MTPDFIAGRLVADHDDRCAIHKGHPCNCCLAALSFGEQRKHAQEAIRHAWDDLKEELERVRRT